ncbi:hypothetical protein BDZ89DRAFT_595924 [Hymenopellis radicata]|nr:hypothetical protein BDZ89DRAFT_595924 [Hymenopellis radicata]
MASSDIVCNLCNRQVAKYTCPSCNAPYCSLECFRSPTHGECSEGFYRKEITTEGATAKAQERVKMMETLKRLEEAPDDSDDDEEEEEDVDDRFAGVDLDDTDALWQRLTPEERTRFLASPFSVLSFTPWWEETGSEAKPPLPDIPAALKPTPTIGIMHNLFAISVAYAYTCRHLAVTSVTDSDEAPVLLTTFLPFLTETNSTLVFASVDDAITSLSSKDVPASALLSDALVLLRPHVVTEAGLHPHDNALRMLGDLHDAFMRKPKVRRKLVWYAACVRTCVGRQSMLGRVVDIIAERQKVVDEENKHLEESTSSLKII